MTNKKILLILIILDLLWSIVALAYDWSAIFAIPMYFWPFVVICPIYPFILAVTWLQIFRNNHINSYLIAFATIPSVAYFIGAIIYYSAYMVSTSFNIWLLGGIFWVAFYGLQAIYLSIKKPIAKMPTIVATSFLLVSFIVQYLTKSYDYLDFSVFNVNTLIAMYIVVFVTIVLYFFIIKNFMKELVKIK